MLYGWAVIFDTNNIVNPLMNRIEFTLKIDSGYYNGASCYPESENANLGAR